MAEAKERGRHVRTTSETDQRLGRIDREQRDRLFEEHTIVRYGFSWFPIRLCYVETGRAEEIGKIGWVSRRLHACLL